MGSRKIAATISKSVAAGLLSVLLISMVTIAVETQVNVLYRLQMSDGCLLERDNFQYRSQRQGHFHRRPRLNWQSRKGMNTEAVDQSRLTG